MKNNPLAQKLCLSLVFLAAGGAPFPARAFPPAPPHRITGLVRDEFGTPVSVGGWTVTLMSSTGVQITTSIVPFEGADVNYTLSVPMDSGSGGKAYTANALTPSALYTLMVFNGQTTNTPIEMTRGLLTLGQPAQTSTQNLTMGTDSTGDGLPDQWKQLIMLLSGGAISFASIQPNAYPPGSRMTYLQAFLAGTYPWDPASDFQISFIGLNGTTATLQIPTAQGRVYSIQGSPDMLNWTPLPFQLTGSGAGAPQYLNYQSTTVGQIQVDVTPPVSTGGTNQFFRGQVQ